MSPAFFRDSLCETMRVPILLVLLLAGEVCVHAQAPAGDAAAATSPQSQTYGTKTDPAVFTSEAGYTYSYPADWEVVDTKPMLPVQRLKAEQDATSDMERKGASCVEIQLMIRHGDPKSVILVMYLDFKCVGVELKQSDLASTGMGMSQGLTKSFKIKEAKYGAFKLGSHTFWIERAEGSPTEYPEKAYSLETTCTILKKGLVCWLDMAASPDAITAFESGKVSLEGEPQSVLVPSSAFQLAGK